MVNTDVILVVVASYVVGSVCFGYYLVRFRTGRDIRDFGSGNPGARNAGRLLGSAGFFLTLLGDAGKGAFAVWLAYYLGLSLEGIMAAIIAAIAGHMWPLQLQFRGGKGFATAIGAFLVFDYRLALMVAVMAVLAMVVLRRTTVGGLAAMAAAPVIVYQAGYPAVITGGIAVVSVLVLYGHQGNLREAFSGVPAITDRQRSLIGGSEREKNQ